MNATPTITNPAIIAEIQRDAIEDYSRKRDELIECPDTLKTPEENAAFLRGIEYGISAAVMTITGQPFDVKAASRAARW